MTDLAHAARSVEALIRADMSRVLAPGQVVELRALGVTMPDEPPRVTVRGYFDNVADLARAAASLDGYARGIYFTLNPLRPELLDRAPNRIDPAAQSATDKDVVRRRWLPLDFDPVRPKDSNSTQAELDAAFDRADTVWRDLRRQGWADNPVSALSGNGWHLLFPVDLRPDDDIVRRAIRNLAAKYSDSRVTLDKSVHNPSRIWKCYGTLACKGPQSPERPRRRARVFGAWQAGAA